MVFDLVFFQVLIGFGAAWLATSRERKARMGFLKQLLAAIGPIIFGTFATVLLLGSLTPNQIIGIGAAISFVVALLSFNVLSKQRPSPPEA